MAVISYFSDEIKFKLPNEDVVSDWLTDVVSREKQLVSDLNIIFMSDDKLLDLNRRFLNHDYFTDVITFPGYGEVLSGEIYISIERVKENAANLEVEFENELNRVILHGLLHILGYDDKSISDIKEMRAKEDFYLDLRKL